MDRPIVVHLVVPAHRAEMHSKALQTAGADEVVFDLEDAVAPDAKAAARQRLADTLEESVWRERAVAVRVNTANSPEHERDLAMCASLGLEHLTIVVPKVEVVADIEAAAMVARVQALIETPKGLTAARVIAEHVRVVALILGYADLAAALGRRGAERDDARWLVAQEAVLAAARIGGAAAVDGPCFALHDRQTVAASAWAARELGFDGKWAIHPAQLEPIQAAFAATARECRWAWRVKEAVSSAGAAGGATAALEGMMVDGAMERQADRLLALARSEPLPAPEDHGCVPRMRALAAPYSDQLQVGATFGAPAVTLTEGHATVHQAIVGDRLRLALDAELYAAVTGTPGLLAHPMLVCDMAIGQSSSPSMRVLGNLFYQGLAARPVPLGTTLKTTTEVVARRAASRGRGIVALRVRTVAGNGVPVLDFHRAPLLPARPGSERLGEDDLRMLGHCVDAAALIPAQWDLKPLRVGSLGPLFTDLRAGDLVVVEARETVTAATELARLSLNLAHTHTDASQGPNGQRLVYGGHVIGVAAAHVTRALPDLATILAWQSCDHLGPTFEGDRLASRLELTACEPLADGGLVHIRVLTTACTQDDLPREVLDWRLVGLMP